MTVYLVGAGPGDPGLLTRRGADLLARADVVLHDRLVSPAVLHLVPPTARLIDVGKDPDGADGGSGRQDEIARLLVEHGRASPVVVRLKGGDPFLFGRGGEEMEVLAQAGIPWEVVPGVTSAFGVPAAAGIPVTQRGLSSSVTVVTGRVGDAGGGGGPDWEALAHAEGTLVVLMGMTTRAAIADALAARRPGTGHAGRRDRARDHGRHSAWCARRWPVWPGSTWARRPSSSSARWPRWVPTLPGPPRPLAGRTVVVTRSGRSAHALAEALERAGAAALELPLTRQIDPSDAGAALKAAAAGVAGHRWVVLTSVNAVERFMAELRDARALGDVQVAAIGPATADALRRAGVEPDLVPARHSAQGLVDEFPGPRRRRGAPGPLSQRRHGAADTVTEGLGRLGWDVRRVEAYRTVPLGAPDPALVAR